MLSATTSQSWTVVAASVELDFLASNMTGQLQKGGIRGLRKLVKAKHSKQDNNAGLDLHVKCDQTCLANKTIGLIITSLTDIRC